jgi:hypothetical protein
MKIRALLRTLLLGAALGLPASALAQLLHTHECKVIEVATFPNRVHVSCQDAVCSLWYGCLRFYAVPTSNAGEAGRLTTLGSAALTGAGAGALAIDFDWSNLDAASYGCAVADCRRPLLIRLK